MKIPIEEPHQRSFSTGSLSFVYVHDDAPLKGDNRAFSHIFWKHSFNNYLKNLSILFVSLFHTSVSFWISSHIEICYKVCIFQMRIGIVEVCLIGFQSLRKLDCLQIIRKRWLSPKNKNFKKSITIWDLWRGFISERKLPRVKVINTIT